MYTKCNLLLFSLHLFSMKNIPNLFFRLFQIEMTPNFILTLIWHHFNKHMNLCSVPRSPKCAASMWLGCFLRMAVRPRANESMLAEMALMATWLGPAASWMAWWFLASRDGDWRLAGAARGQQGKRARWQQSVSGLNVRHQCDLYEDISSAKVFERGRVNVQKPQCVRRVSEESQKSYI